MNAGATKKTSPIAWVPTAYFAMGLPFVVVNMVAVLMFEGMGVDNASIAFWTSLILLPWTLKPLWSPFLELFKTKKFYVVTTQILTGTAFGLTALSLTMPNFFAPAILFLAVAALSGATHDIACDGVYMSELTPAQQAKYIGWQGAFYNIAKIAATGGLVYLAGWLIDRNSASGDGSFAANRSAWTAIMAMLAATMTVLGIYHIFILPSSEKKGECRPGAKAQGLRRVARAVERAARILHQEAHLGLHTLHNPLPLRRRIRGEDSAAFPQGRP